MIERDPTIARNAGGASIIGGAPQGFLAYRYVVGGRKTVSGADRALGASIRKARERLGVSITDLGLAYGGSRQTVQFWEAGKHFPPLSDFPRLCQLLKTDPNHLLGMDVMAELTEQEVRAAALEIQTLAQQTKNANRNVVRLRVGQGRLRRRPAAATSARR